MFPSEDQKQQQQQKPLQQQAEKVARIRSSSKTEKKQPKASFHHQFSMGFRSYVRHFRGAILFSVLQRHGVLLPGGDFFHLFSHVGTGCKGAKIHSSSKRKKEPKESFSMGCKSYVRHFRGAILGLLRPSEAWCFLAGRLFFPWCFPIRGPAPAAVAKASAAAGGKGSQNS